MANENIIREVDEELRSERARNLWKRFGPWVIVAAVVVVLGVAVNEGWAWWQGSNAARSSDQFYAALALADGTDYGSAQKALDELTRNGTGGYPTLARFRAAALFAQQGRPLDAIAAYDALSTGETNSHIRELALVLAGYQLVDAGELPAVEQHVQSLINPASPMRNAAREVIGLAQYKAGQLDAAARSFEDAIEDPAAGQEMTQRLQIYIAQLISEGATDPAVKPVAAAPADATPAAAAPAADATPTADAAPAADAAPTAVDSAPALDTAPPATPAAPATPAPAN